MAYDTPNLLHLSVLNHWLQTIRHDEQSVDTGATVYVELEHRAHIEYMSLRGQEANLYCP
jgi:hypothetical protein